MTVEEDLGMTLDRWLGMTVNRGAGASQGGLVKSVIIFVAAASFALAGTVTSIIEVSPADVTLNQNDNYTVVRLALNQQGLVGSWTYEPGSPLLPVVSGNVLIPPGAEVDGMEVEALERVELGEYRVHPVQLMRPLSQMSSVSPRGTRGGAFVEPDARWYGTDEVFPAEPLSTIPAGSKAGFRIAGFLFCPFEYRPISGKLGLITRARITVRYQENSVPVMSLSQSQLDEFAPDVAQLVVNQDDIARMAPPVAELDAEPVDVVMFTNAALEPSLAGLRAWFMRKGYFTRIVRHDTLTTPGRDVPEKMRNFLKTMFAEHGLKYVILAGDYDKCPLRYGYSTYQSSSIPADMYFGDLDGSWNGNNNSYFGEMTGDSVDLFHDIYVGRLPLDDANNAANFLRKDTTYEIMPDTGYLNNVLLPFEALWSNIDYYGRIVNKNIALALNAVSPWEVDSMLSMPPATCIASQNAGRHHFHFAGHGSSSGFGSTFSTSHLSSLTNIAKPSIVHSMACDCGWFDSGTDCLGEQFVNTTNGGAVATMLNARFGWGAPPCQGPNENMNLQFYYNYLRGMTLGKAHGLSKDFLRNESFSQLTTRWATYTNTLQGDPTMLMWREAPQTAVVEHPATLAAMPQVVPVTIECGDRPLKDARVAITHLGELLGRGVTNSFGQASVPLTGIEDTWTLKVSVTGQDIALYEATIPVTAGSAAPLLEVHHHEVDDANGRLDPNEEADVYFVVENTGNDPAVSAQGKLRTNSGWVTVLDSTSDYGTVAPGDTARGDVYRVRVGRDCPHGHSAELMLEFSSTDASWSYTTELVVGLPNARAGAWAIHDTGDYVLSVCANGGIGTLWWRGEGFGFIHPKSRAWSSSALMHGSLIIGTDTTWVCDNYYGTPWQVTPQEFAVQESLRMVYPSELGDKEFLCTFTDANHPAPKGLVIDHRSYGSADIDHKDFVVLEYRIHNTGTLPLSGLYVGVACDFRTANWNQNDQYDYAGTDSARNIAYIKATPETVAIGIRHIYPSGMNGYANSINHTTYINDGFTKAEKMKFLDGRLRQTTGTSQGNWHGMTSSGPYTIPAGDSQIVAFAICGGFDTSNTWSSALDSLLRHSDSAAVWYAPPVGMAEPEQSRPIGSVQISPRVYKNGFAIHYSLAPLGKTGLEPISVVAYDASGRERDRVVHQPTAAGGEFFWKPNVAPGVFFLRVNGLSEKLVRVE